MMAWQKVASNEFIVLSRALEILHVCLRTREITMTCIWRLGAIGKIKDFYDSIRK
jgi:hypothetical protein